MEQYMYLVQESWSEGNGGLIAVIATNRLQCALLLKKEGLADSGPEDLVFSAVKSAKQFRLEGTGHPSGVIDYCLAD